MQTNPQPYEAVETNPQPFEVVGTNPQPPQQMVLPGPNMLPPDPVSSDMMWLDADFWNGNILSTSNWLDAVVDHDFFDASLDYSLYQPGPTYPTPTSWDASRNMIPMPQQSPSAGVGSITSKQSGVSTETAADACASTEEVPSQDGEYYVDGQPSRLPRAKRRKLAASPADTRTSLSTVDRPFSLRCPIPSSPTTPSRIYIPLEIYEKIREAFVYTCANPSGPWLVFQDSFPEPEVFENLLHLYFTSFQKTLPFLHPASFNAGESHWVLILALTAVGSHYLEDGAHFAVSLHELLRRCLLLAQGTNSWSPPSGIILAQVQLLQLVGLLYSGNEQHTECGLDMHGLLTSSHDSAVREYDKLIRVPPAGNRSVQDLGEKWHTWTRLETAKRTAYSAWLLSCMVRYHFQSRRALSLADAVLPLPCHEVLYAAVDAANWDEAASHHAAPPPLQEALQQLYVDKRLPKERGEFARILIVHGICQRQFDVERFVGSPLSAWEPTAEKQDSAALLPKQPIWFPSIAMYNKWQNSACDCLDILHWQANATIGKASGYEHPTVLHLHIARIILLAPMKNIVMLARAMTRDEDALQKTEIQKHRHIIQRWAVQGVFKARLAAIHAGVTLWHVRRYSTEAFYDSPAVALAALCLWAFARFSIKQRATNDKQSRASQGQANQNVPGEDSSDEAACGIILLDRPTDDELVQEFIRRGHNMTAHITGVGDLYGPDGSLLVLTEGCKLLDSLKCWGVASRWSNLMHRLLLICESEKD